LKPYADITDPRVVKALAHPVRAQVLAMLGDRVASPNELSRELGVALGSVSYHVRRLVSLGFLELVRKTPRRGAIEHYYTAIHRPRITDAAWGEVPPIVKRAMVSANLDHVARHVNAAAVAGGFDPADAHLTRTPLIVDPEGWRTLADELEAMHERVQEIAAESAARLADAEDQDGTEATVVMMLFSSVPTDAVGAAAMAAAADADPTDAGVHHHRRREARELHA
jgi:DNA-binding transcriptional ArsR family regulator